MLAVRGRYPEVLEVSDGSVRLAARLGAATEQQRTEAFAPVAADLRDRGLVKAWRGEPAKEWLSSTWLPST